MNTLLLDTQILIALRIGGLESLPAPAAKLIADPDTKRIVSVVTLTEIAVKAKIGKITASSASLSKLLSD